MGVEFAALALVDDEGLEARGLVARSSTGDIDWWSDMRIGLRDEPSGIASAYYEAAPVAVYDTESSALVSPRLAQAAGAKSAAFVPLTVGERVIAVLVAASVGERRAFTPEELRLMQAVAGEAAIALDRTRSAAALDEALSRERLVATISRRIRSSHDLDTVTRVAVTETGRALGASRCFLRLGEPGELLPMRAEWWVDGLSPIGDELAQRLPASNLAARVRRTVAVADVLDAKELDEAEPAGRDALEQLGSRAVLATPVVAFDRMLGVLGLHRPEPGPWTAADVSLAEAVADEIALAIHVAGLLEENQRRIGEQGALLKAAQVVTSELELNAVLQRLVDQVATLLRAEAVDCYLLDPGRGVLRCAAVHGFPAKLVGYEFPIDKGLAGRAIARGRPALVEDYAEILETVPNETYAGFHAAMVAPMRWAGEVKGVLGVGSRDPQRRLTSGEAGLLDAFANLAALALRNAESFEERSRQARVQRGFYRIASALGQPISLEETFDALAQAAAEALGGASAAVLMPVDGDLRLAGLHALPAPLVRFLEDGLSDPGDPLRSSARRRRVLVSSGLAEDDRFGAGWQRVAEEAGYRSLLAAPVETPREDDAALVLVFFPEEHHFADDDLELARNLTGAARGALERSDLFEGERRARALAQQLARTSSLLAPELDPAALLDEVAQRAPELLLADAAVLRLLEGDELVARRGQRRVRRRRARDPRCPRPRAWRATPSSPAPRSRWRTRARTSGCSRPTPSSAPATRATSASRSSAQRGRCTACSPSTRRAPRQWREEEIEALGAFAGNASAALSSAELYQSVALEKERSVAILSNIADGIVAVDREGHVVLWNAAAETITGVPAAEALGHPPARGAAARAESGESPGGERLVPIRARRRGDLALAHRGGHARPGRRRRRPDLRLPRHLGRAGRRADEVGVRLQRLPGAALAADLDLRLCRDAAPRRRRSSARRSATRSSATSPRRPAA